MIRDDWTETEITAELDQPDRGRELNSLRADETHIEAIPGRSSTGSELDVAPGDADFLMRLLETRLRLRTSIGSPDGG